LSHFSDDIATEFTPDNKKQKRLRELHFWINNYVSNVNRN